MTKDMYEIEHGSIIFAVDSAMSELKEIFIKARCFEQIPLHKIRSNMILTFIELSKNTELNHIIDRLRQEDYYTYKHSMGVALISGMIGVAIGLLDLELSDLTGAAFLHDIGKTRISKEVLNKPGQLTSDEFNQMKNHTMYGFEIIRAAGIPHRHALVALQHHEREDGSGYPLGKKGNDIDLFSKIVAVADVFHAMVSMRVYKSAMPFYNALQEISRNAHEKLEPTIVLCFLRQIMRLLIGNRVILSNGSEGEIIMIHSSDPLNPVVDVNGRYIDLSKEPTIFLNEIV